MRKNNSLALIVLAGILCTVMFAGLAACSNEDGEVGNIIDRALWDRGGYPSQQEILDHLQEKYDEEFALISLNPGARFFQGVAHPVRAQDLIFSLEMHDSEGNPMPLEEVRDDYQARLAERFIREAIHPIFIDQFGLAEVANLRVEIALFDRSERGTLPAHFEWTPADGLAALVENEDVTTRMTINLMLETVVSLDAFNAADFEQLVERMVADGAIPLSGEMNIRAADEASNDPATSFAWTVIHDRIVAFEMDPETD